jgi:hypothetical protein
MSIAGHLYSPLIIIYYDIRVRHKEKKIHEGEKIGPPARKLDMG